MVFVGDGSAERGDHAVPAQLPDRTTVPLRDRLHRGVTALHHLVQHLGIERRSPVGRAHVGRDADDLAPPRPRRRRSRRADPVTEDVALQRPQLGRRGDAP